MRTAASLICGVMIALVAGVFIGERWQLHNAAAAIETDPKRAFTAYSSMAGRVVWFVDRGEIVTGRRAAAGHLVPIALREREYDTVIALCGTVLAEAEPTDEAVCVEALHVMPEEHLAFAKDLLDSGSIDKALETLARAESIYEEQPSVLSRVHSLQTRGLLTVAGRWLEAGDSKRLLDALVAIDPAAPAPRQHEAARLAEAGIRRAGDHLLETADYPGFLVWFRASCERLRPRAGLFDACVSVFAEEALRMFELPGPTPILDTAAIDELPLTAVTGRTSSRSQFAVLNVANDTGGPLTVTLRGLGHSGTRRTLLPGARVSIQARPGRYGEAIAGANGRLAPYFGVVDLMEGAEYGQTFTTRELAIESPEPRESGPPADPKTLAAIIPN